MPTPTSPTPPIGQWSSTASTQTLILVSLRLYNYVASSFALILFFINGVAPEGLTEPSLPSPPSETECPPNFIGPKCEVPICNPFNGHLVYLSSDGYFCKCVDGVVGTHCETIICQNGGILKDGTECDCSETGFTGRFCNVESASASVKKNEKNGFFFYTLLIYTGAILLFFVYVWETKREAANHIDAPYSASRKESKLYKLYYYIFFSKDVKLW
uniref:EGF-like domain-containing protein n=1 Tax=Panagrellus redivivus TaxID=6233 RepID=A0A7E4VBH0_PANRE